MKDDTDEIRISEVIRLKTEISGIEKRVSVLEIQIVPISKTMDRINGFIDKHEDGEAKITWRMVMMLLCQWVALLGGVFAMLEWFIRNR
jgi:hypothetical protein